MNILLVSQCNKNALKETRRILDQFAERIGERTWQTPITRAGLDTLRQMLRRTARKNTAVACHWIKGRGHSELLWVVGNTSRFNAQGAVPTETTTRDILRQDDENDWHTGEDILILASLAALFHDLGKACAAFQAKLRGQRGNRADRYRHEWISLRLFQAFVGDDEDHGWLQRLAQFSAEDHDEWIKGLLRDGLDSDADAPFRNMPPLAAAIGWLVVTHHRLPQWPRQGREEGFRSDHLEAFPAVISADWNQLLRERAEEDVLNDYWRFEGPLPVVTERWQRRAHHLAERLISRLRHHAQSWLDNPYIMHLARMSLMLADHHYSSLTASDRRLRGETGYSLYANTDRETRELSQPLDEHLLGVEADVRAITRSLSTMDRALPRLARHKGFRKRSADRRFAWQDHAFDLATSLRESAGQRGFFGVNMASTGYGKTLANGRIAYALSDPGRGARFSVALGLRTLTLQTGEAFRELLGLGEDELAIRVGGTASRELFDFFADQAAESGSASSQALMDEYGHVYFEGDFENHPVLRRLRHDPGVRKLLSAPVLVSTVDHLVPATEGTRGGRQIAPMMRLMSSDLILDEVDDFGLEDLPALSRLVNWSGMLGGRVLLSSATLPPALVEGLYRAYRAGRAIYQKNRGEPGAPVDIPCAWFDEHDRRHVDCADQERFRSAHQDFAVKRQRRLSRHEARRRAAIVPVSTQPGKSQEQIATELADVLLEQSKELHECHRSLDPRTGRQVSFGLVRMANIEPLTAVARALIRNGAPAGTRIHLCVYHSQFPSLSRSAIESHLDSVLDRREELAVFEKPDIRAAIDGHHEANHMFVVLGSPVTEVGRDHDYDWAIVEPSSMRSLIQLAGRVRRHRSEPCKVPNIHLLHTNVRALRQTEGAAFTRPGFEGAGRWQLNSHDLRELLRSEEYEVVDARPRVLPPEELAPNDFLVDLEHARLADTLLPQAASPGGDAQRRGPARRAVRQRSVPRLNASSWYELPRATLSGDLPRQQPFRHQDQEQVELVLMPDEAGEDWLPKKLWYQRGKRTPEALVDASEEVRKLDLSEEIGQRISPWAVVDYLEKLGELAEARGASLEACAHSFGLVQVPQRKEGTRGWQCHPWLGFFRWA
ncbi:MULTISPECIES: type I-F CRISPR-associated helicase Cas3f [Halorhodospira]|uniref:type I-F CRISPR-associated helicase Cas3f n=1 Tax=Halorhodospira TaxID=85108 RepID=UPI001EE87EF2|nr:MULTISPECIES: type I-F CRISPR-associated helicase Cas3f [Halorhodospira]MCG5528051.1 type I-F CRISPR-associated helicase Cas3f [Halorhodospira halophila]MCG5543077.1 type I-F CRISPR-associated helicase Cas3f [Halorhodospira sp. 9628]